MRLRLNELQWSVLCFYCTTERLDLDILALELLLALCKNDGIQLLFLRIAQLEVLRIKRRFLVFNLVSLYLILLACEIPIYR